MGVTMKFWLFACAGLFLAACVPTLTPIPPPFGDAGTATASMATVIMATAAASFTPLPSEQSPVGTRTSTVPAYIPPPERTPPPPPPPVPTRTPSEEELPTATPALTASPGPTTVPPVTVLPAGKLPPITRDVLFVQGEQLLRWDHAAGRIDILADHAVTLNAPIWSPDAAHVPFALSADGRSAVLAQSFAPGSYTLSRLDLAGGGLTTLVEDQAPALLQLALSPDGQWLAYIPQGTEPAGPGGARRPPGALRPDGGPWSGVIYAVRLDAPGAPREVGYCAEDYQGDYAGWCAGFVWSPDSRALAWSDGRAVWFAGLGEPAQMVVANAGGPQPFGGGYHAVQAWSPLGRYLVAAHGYYGGSDLVVIDVQTGQVTLVLETNRISALPTWLPDGRLFVAYQPYDVMGILQPPCAGVWRIDPAAQPWLARDRTVTLSDDTADEPAAPFALPDGRVVFALINDDNTRYATRGLYVLGPADAAPLKLNGLPPWGRNFSLAIAWAPDGSGALLYGHEYDYGGAGLPAAGEPPRELLFYAPADGRALYDVSAIGPGVCCMQWAR
jgi:hypothetical protein